MNNIRIGDIVILKTGHAPQIILDIVGKYIRCGYLRKDIKDILIKPKYNIEISNLFDTTYNTRLRPPTDFKLAISRYSDRETCLIGDKDGNYALESDLTYELLNMMEDYHNIIDFKIDYDMDRNISHFCRFSINGKSIDDDYFNVSKNQTKGKTKGTIMTRIGTLYKTIDGDIYGTYLATNSQGDYVLEMRDGKGTVQSFNKDKIEEVVPYTFAVKWQGVNGHTHYLGTKGMVHKDDLFLCKTHLKYGRVVELNTKQRDCNQILKAYRLTNLDDFVSVKEEK